MMESKAIRPIWYGRIAGGEMATAADKIRRESKTRDCENLESRSHASQMPPTGTGEMVNVSLGGRGACA